MLVSSIQQSESATHTHTRVYSHSVSHVRLCATPWIAHQVPLSMGFSRQEYWSGLSSTPGALPNPGTEPASLVSYIYISPLFCISFPFRSSKSTEFPVLHSRFSPVIYFIHSSVYMSIPISQFIPPPAIPPPQAESILSNPLGSQATALKPCSWSHVITKLKTKLPSAA